MVSSTHTHPTILEGILAALPTPIFDAICTQAHPASLGGAEAVEVADLLGIDFAATPFTVEDLRLGLEVERDLETDCTPSMVDLLDDDLVELGRIAVANLQERSDYYSQLTRAQAPGDLPLVLSWHVDVGAD